MATAKKATESKATKTTRSKKPVAGTPETTAVLEPKLVERSESPEEIIRRRAYELYMQRNGYGGSPEEDWFRAEAEILGRSA